VGVTPLFDESGLASPMTIGMHKFGIPEITTGCPTTEGDLKRLWIMHLGIAEHVYRVSLRRLAFLGDAAETVEIGPEIRVTRADLARATGVALDSCPEGLPGAATFRLSTKRLEIEGPKYEVSLRVWPAEGETAPDWMDGALSRIVTDEESGRIAEALAPLARLISTQDVEKRAERESAPEAEGVIPAGTSDEESG
jgi:hypothetical protein